MEFQKSHRQRLAANNDKKVLSTEDDEDVCQQREKDWYFPGFSDLAFSSFNKEKGGSGPTGCFSLLPMHTSLTTTAVAANYMHILNLIFLYYFIAFIILL